MCRSCRNKRPKGERATEETDDDDEGEEEDDKDDGNAEAEKEEDEEEEDEEKDAEAASAARKSSHPEGGTCAQQTTQSIQENTGKDTQKEEIRQRNQSRVTFAKL